MHQLLEIDLLMDVELADPVKRAIFTELFNLETKDRRGHQQFLRHFSLCNDFTTSFALASELLLKLFGESLEVFGYYLVQSLLSSVCVTHQLDYRQVFVSLLHFLAMGAFQLLLYQTSEHF